MSLQSRLATLITAIGTDIKTLTTAVAQAEKRAVLVPDTDSTVDEASAVVWKRTSDGAYVAYKMVQGQGATPNRSYGETDIVDAEAGGTGFASLSQQARVSVSGSRRAAILNLSATAALREVRAQAENDAGTLFDKKVIDSDGKSDFVQGLAGSKMRLFGPFDSGVTAQLAAQSDATKTVTHNLGLNTATQTVLPIGYLYDGFFAALAGWRIGGTTTNTQDFSIGNPTARNDIRAGWRGYFLVIG